MSIHRWGSNHISTKRHLNVDSSITAGGRIIFSTIRLFCAAVLVIATCVSREFRSKGCAHRVVLACEWRFMIESQTKRSGVLQVPRYEDENTLGRVFSRVLLQYQP